MTPLLAKSPALFDMVQDCTTPAQTLSKVGDWLDHLITTALHSANKDEGSPRIIGIKDNPKGTMVCRTFDDHPDLDVSTDAWYSRVSLQDIPNAIYQASTAMKKQGEVTNTVHDAAWSAIREKAKQEEIKATNRLVNNLKSIITKYLDVGEALGLVGHDRGLIADELFSDGETRQTGKSHDDVLRKAKSVRTADLTLEQYRPVHERMNEMKAENAEQREHLAAWQSELIHLAKNLKAIDDKEGTYFPSDPQYAKDLGDKVGAKCYEMRTQIKELKATSEVQAISITEHKTALNAAHDEIAKLKAELAALKAAPPSPLPSDPLTTAYAVIGEMVVKQRGG